METFTHTTHEGVDISFAHLTLYDLFGDPKVAGVNGLVPIYRQQLKRQLLDNLRTAEADKERVLVELEGFDKHHREKRPMAAFLDYVRESPFAVEEMVERSFAIANPGAAVPKISATDKDAISWKLMEPLGIYKTDPAEQEDKEPGTANNSTYGDGGPDAPNAKAPLTYSTTPMTPSLVDGGSTSSVSAVG